MGGYFKSPFRSFLSWRNWRELVPRVLIPWLLRDEFSDARAAGAVNGTPASPGPGTRLVTDTDGDALSIGGGVLSVANPNANWTSARLVYSAPTIARVAGQSILYRVTPGAANQFWWTGLSTVNNPQGPNNANVEAPWYFPNNGVLTAYVNTTQVLRLYGYSGAATYDLAHVLRATGVHYLLKIGSNWILLYPQNVGATGALYLVTNTFSGVYTADYFRVPDAQAVIQPIVSDSFDRANGAMGNTDGAGTGQVAETGGAGIAWAADIGTWAIAGNLATSSILAGGLAIATVDCGEADVVHAAKCTRAGNEVGVVVRYVDGNNYIHAYHDGVNAVLRKVVGGVGTVVATIVLAYAAGARIVVWAYGNSFRVHYNDVSITNTPNTISDAALQSSTRVGLYTTNIGNSMNDMETWACGI